MLANREDTEGVLSLDIHGTLVPFLHEILMGKGEEHGLNEWDLDGHEAALKQNCLENCVERGVTRV